MIYGFIITLITFPGVIVHELAHALFCKLTGTQIFKVCYFQLESPAGYVLHGPPSNLWKHILIGVGPFIINSSIGIALGMFAHFLKMEDRHSDFTSVIFYWLAISIAMHSFPSTGDAKSIWTAIWQKGAPIFPRVVGVPLVTIIFLGAIGSVFWLDLVYGVCLVLAVPEMLF
jgi:hypothetical protein